MLAQAPRRLPTAVFDLLRKADHGKVAAGQLVLQALQDSRVYPELAVALGTPVPLPFIQCAGDVFWRLEGALVRHGGEAEDVANHALPYVWRQGCLTRRWSRSNGCPSSRDALWCSLPLHRCNALCPGKAAETIRMSLAFRGLVIEGYIRERVQDWASSCECCRLPEVAIEGIQGCLWTNTAMSP